MSLRQRGEKLVCDGGERHARARTSANREVVAARLR
jgi:hypothetical protein